ncbi:hypothetical protein HDU81_001779 [Chytriomyces hyalinus]|nr:hypothetical protein HDU81_001779 [Chytriomyces hyalinus]
MSDDISSRILNSMDEAMNKRKEVNYTMRRVGSAKYKDHLSVETIFQSRLYEIDDAINKAIRRVISFVNSQDYDHARDEVVTGVGKVRKMCSDVTEYCTMRCDFIDLILTLYPGIEVMSSQRLVDSAVTIHLNNYPSGRVILFPEHWARTAQTDSRSIMMSLIYQRVETDSVKSSSPAQVHRQ